MGFLDGVFERKSARSGAIARATGGSMVATAGSYAIGGNWDIDKAIRDGYERVLWVFRCVDAIASAQANIPMIVRRGDKHDGEEILYPDINRLLNRRPNTYEDSWQFRYRLSSQLLLSRRGAFIEVIPSNSGGIAELHLLPPGQVEPIPGVRDANGAQKFVDGYKVRRSDWVEDELKPEQVIWIKAKTHPTDPYAQMTPLMAAGLAVETDFFARVFNKNFLANDGRPGMLISVKGELDSDDALEIKRRFSGGYAQAGQTTVIEADGIEVADLAVNPRDVQWAEAIRGSKEDILLAYGTPESVLGNASGRTFDNADAEWEGFYMSTVVNHCDCIARPLDVLTGTIYDEDMVVYDYSKVDVLQRQGHTRRQARGAEFASGTATLNDYLEERGEQPIDHPAARGYFLPNGLFVAREASDMEVVGQMKPVGMPPVPDPAAAARAGAQQGAAIGQRNFSNIIAARAMQMGKAAPILTETKVLRVEEKTDPHSHDRVALEGFVDGALSIWSDRQQDVFFDRLMHTKVRKGTRHWDGEPGTKALDAAYVVEMDKWGSDVRSVLETQLRKIARREALSVAQDIERMGLTKVLHSQGIGDPTSRSPLGKIVGKDTARLIDQIVNPVLDIVEASAKAQSARIAKRINEMDEAGASMDQIKSEVQRMMSTRSDWRRSLATTVTTTTIESAKASVYKVGEDFVEKTWNATYDERTRDTHWKADGQTRKANRPFRVGGHKMMHPQDPTAPIGEVANCRCWTSWSLVVPPRLQG